MKSVKIKVIRIRDNKKEYIALGNCQNISRIKNSFFFIVNSYYASVFPSLRFPHPPSSKRARLMLTNPGRPQMITQLPRKQSPTLTHQQQSQPQPQSQSQPQSQQQHQHQQQQSQQQQQQQQQQRGQQQHHHHHFQEELSCIIAQLKTYSKLNFIVSLACYSTTSSNC